MPSGSDVRTWVIGSKGRDNWPLHPFRRLGIILPPTHEHQLIARGIMYPRGCGDREPTEPPPISTHLNLTDLWLKNGSSERDNIEDSLS